MLLSGDNFQLPPLGCTAWYAQLVAAAVAEITGAANAVAPAPATADARGLELLSAARRFELPQIMRVIDCAATRVDIAPSKPDWI